MNNLYDEETNRFRQRLHDLSIVATANFSLVNRRLITMFYGQWNGLKVDFDLLTIHGFEIMYERSAKERFLPNAVVMVPYLRVPTFVMVAEALAVQHELVTQEWESAR